jgi:enamine deaminase RidA (YjgF/YER057c/UK114 family)
VGLSEIVTVNPGALARPVGFSHGVMRSGTLLALAGQNGHRPDGTLDSPGDLVGQTDRALANLLAVVYEAGGAPEDVIKLVIYVKDVASYRSARREIRHVWQRHFGDYYPAMTLLAVTDFFDGEALIEIDGLAVIADSPTINVVNLEA